MDKEIQKNPNSNNEEVDLIKLLNYFKEGIKSLFRKIGQLIEGLLQFIVLLKRQWPILLGLVLAGAAYGFYLNNFSKSETNSYEMVIHSNPISNIELYAFSSELNQSDTTAYKSEGLSSFKKLGVKSIQIEPIEREEDVINNYFDQIEMATLRNEQTDTLFFHTNDVGAYKSKMKNSDYSLQKLKIKVKGKIPPGKIQERFLNYINNLPGPKKEQEIKMAILTSYESILKRNIENIDSILSSKAKLNKNLGPSGTDQTLVNTASRGNVEYDLLKYSEIMTRKLYGTQKKIQENKGVYIISNLRSIKEESYLNNAIIKYSLIGFVLAIFIILLLQFNKFLNRISAQRNY